MSQAFDDALGEIDSLTPESYKDSTMILQVCCVNYCFISHDSLITAAP